MRTRWKRPTESSRPTMDSCVLKDMAGHLSFNPLIHHLCPISHQVWLIFVFLHLSYLLHPFTFNPRPLKTRSCNLWTCHSLHSDHGISLWPSYYTSFELCNIYSIATKNVVLGLPASSQCHRLVGIGSQFYSRHTESESTF